MNAKVGFFITVMIMTAVMMWFLVAFVNSAFNFSNYLLTYQNWDAQALRLFGQLVKDYTYMFIVSTVISILRKFMEIK